MKTKYLSQLLISLITFSTISGQSVIKIVDNFYSDVYLNGFSYYNGSFEESRDALDYRYFSQDMESLIKSNFVSIPKKNSYILTKEKRDDKIIVTSIGKSKNILGNDIEIKRKYLFEKINKKWKISDSFNQISFNHNFKIDNSNWSFYWDLKKAEILDEIQKQIKLTIIKEAFSPDYDNEGLKGRLRITNDSNYDIKNIEILIENFDTDGISVNTFSTTINNIIRSKGYREFDWYTRDCSLCVSQTYEIKFMKSK